MEADLQRHYQIEWQLGSDLPFRRLAVLIRHLPDDSAVRLIDKPIEERDWTTSDYLLDALYRLKVIEITKDHKDPGPHWLSPQYAAQQRAKAAQEARRRVKHREADLRLAQRAARLAAKPADPPAPDPSFVPLRWLRADGTRT